MRLRRYLITGAGGFIGRHLSRSLEADGHEVVKIDNGWRHGDRDDIVSADVTKSEEVLALFRFVEPDVVIHLAAINGTRNFYEKPSLVLEVGLRGILNVVDACEKTGTSALYVASSSEVYQEAEKEADESVPYSCPDPLNPRYSYAVSKMATEMVALNSRIPHVVIFRPHNVYGPEAGEDHVIPQFFRRAEALRPGQPFQVHGDADQSRAFIYVDDFVDGLRVLLQRGVHRSIYHIGTRDEIKIVDLAKRCCA